MNERGSLAKPRPPPPVPHVSHVSDGLIVGFDLFRFRDIFEIPDPSGAQALFCEHVGSRENSNPSRRVHVLGGWYLIGTRSPEHFVILD